MNTRLVSALVLSIAIATTTQAGQLASRPSFNVGTGVQWVDGSQRVLLMAEFAANEHVSGTTSGDGSIKHKYRQYMLVKAKTAIDVEAQGDRKKFSFADFEIVPFAEVQRDDMIVSGYTTTASRDFARFKYAPIGITRELALGKDLGVTISAIGIDAETDTAFPAHGVGAYATVAMNALAIHYLNLSGPKDATFVGGQLLHITAEAGVEGQLSPVLVRLGIGASINGAVGNAWVNHPSNSIEARGEGYAFTSEQELYVRLSLLVPRTFSDYQDVQVFAQAGFKNLYLTEIDGNGKGVVADRVPFIIGLGAQAGF